MFVGILNKAARTTLNQIYNDMDNLMARVSKPPKTLIDLKGLDQLLKDSREGLPNIEAKCAFFFFFFSFYLIINILCRFEPLQKQYELLERCSDISPVPDEETQKLLSLPGKYAAYQAFLSQAESKLIETKSVKKKELIQQLDILGQVSDFNI
jgi:hypothetical protein